MNEHIVFRRRPNNGLRIPILAAIIVARYIISQHYIALEFSHGWMQETLSGT